MAAAWFKNDDDLDSNQDDYSCLNCGHSEDDHLLLEEDDLRNDASLSKWDGRCLVTNCGCEHFR